MYSKDKNANKILLKSLFDGNAGAKKRVHFVGIGGISMYSLAILSAIRGFIVSGSDREESDRTGELILRGINVSIGHSRGNVGGADFVVYSHAIGDSNPELLEAAFLGIRTFTRSEYMGILMEEYSRRIGVSGSHGKSTTTALIDHIFSCLAFAPTTISGADLPIGDPFRIGGRDLLIYEACEYKDSFLDFSPSVAVALNLELDHTDYFADIESLKASFLQSLNGAADLAIINGDDPNLTAIRESISCRTVSFGGAEGNDYCYSITSFKEVGFEFTVSRFGSIIGNFELNIPGVFNVLNATAAIATAVECGLDIELISDAISTFKGIPRRLEYIGNRFGRKVYYDYAHHPTEIRAGISALRDTGLSEVTAIFSAHTYSRTEALLDDFIASLGHADSRILTEIDAVRERGGNITSGGFANAVGGTLVRCEEELLSALYKTNGAILLMGAGDNSWVKEILIKT